MTTETDLVPCPFCGSQASLETQVHSDSRALYLHWHAKVGCVFCFASTGWVIVSNRLPEEDHYVSQDDISKDRVQDVVEIWNARVPSPPAKVYMAHNRTSSLLFATKEAAFYRDEIAQERKRLRKWIRVEGDHNDTCTRQILGETCQGCRCTHGEIDAARGAKPEPTP